MDAAEKARRAGADYYQVMVFRHRGNPYPAPSIFKAYEKPIFIL
jgi:hypothetical protein